GEMQMIDIAGDVAAQVLHTVRPILAPAGAEDNNGARRNRAVFHLPSPQILRGGEVVVILGSCRGHVDHYRGGDKFFYRNLVEGGHSLCKMNRTVQVRPAMFGRSK